MAILDRMRAWWRNRGETASANPTQSLIHRRAYNVSGVYVDESNALTLAACWCATRAIAEPIAAMPYHVFQRLRDGRVERRDHPVDWLLSIQPNPEQTAPDFWHAQMTQLLNWGNAYAEIERNTRGDPLNLWPIEPWRVTLRRNDRGALEYVVSNQTQDPVILDAADVYHLHGLGDGLQGYSVVGMARATIGLGLTMEQFGAEFFGNGARTGAIIKAPPGLNLKKDAVDLMLEEFNKRHGAGKKFSTAFLDKGMEVDYPSVPPEDAQFLQSRKFNVLEIARWYRVPPHLLYELDRATFSNIEHQSLEYVVHTLLPWARKVERQTDVKLFGRNQRGVFYSQFNFDGMLRGDVKSRWEAYQVARRIGVLSANDIRALEEMNPIDGGDLYIVEANMIPIDQLRDKVEAEITKAEQPPPAPQPAPAESQQTNARVLEIARRYGKR